MKRATLINLFDVVAVIAFLFIMLTLQHWRLIHGLFRVHLQSCQRLRVSLGQVGLIATLLWHSPP